MEDKNRKKSSVKKNEDNIQTNDKNIVKTIVRQMSLGVRSSNPLVEKMTPEILDNIIKTEDKHDERKYKDNNNQRIFITILSVIFILAIIVIIYIFKNNSEIIKIIIPLFAGVVAGGFGGFGIGYKKGKSE